MTTVLFDKDQRIVLPYNIINVNARVESVKTHDC